ELSAAREDNKLVIRVKDTGQGIDEAFIPHLFEAFRQADGSTTRRHGGLGLGLAIVKNMVQAHGGRVHAASDGVGKGATFTVELPLLSAPSAVESNEIGASALPSDPVRLSGLRVLVVDDEEDARSLLRRVLEERGATVALAASSDEALHDLKHF